MAQDLSLDDELYERFARDFEPETVDDLILLGEPTDVRVTEKLKNRYNKKKFYTYIGPTVVAVNPYEKSDLYSLDVKSFYHRRQPYELAPHLYSLAEDAYKHMMETGTNQAIVISGESGAGKTESAKIVMDYIAQLGISGIASENIRKIMLESNPLLEAFGNAKTLRNDNSSRFGKFIDLYFSFKGHMEGGYITTCLLEKARVVEQRKGERNFHIFYQLCADDQMRESLGLGNASKFNYLNKNEITVKGINDRAGFKATNDAMRECSISESERSQIYKLCAAILHMGNIKFKYKNPSNPNEGIEVETPDALKKTALLLEVEEDTLREAMSSRTIYIAGKEGQKTAQTPEKAETARDTLAKGIYERLFQWLIRRINASVKRPEEARQCIGILDIYGFEIYQTNSLEQLNINFVNEKIQQQIQKWLQEEQDEYIEEGVPNFKLTKLFNCDPCVKLIEDKPYGIYAFLDEETLFPGGNDENYLAKMNSAFEKNSAYEVSRFKSLNFGLQHFVTQVTYSVKGWVEKNRDTLYGDLIVAMRTSRNEFVNSLFPTNERLPQKDKLQRTISQQFKEDVGQVVGKLKSKRLHFIKCIKPNHEKKPSEFTDDLVKDQVKYLGLCENIHVRTSGYYFKMPYDKFLGRYKLCSDKTFPRFHGTSREGCEHIIKDMQLQGRYAFGKTKIFLSSPVQLFALDERIQSKRGEMAAIIQRNYKKYKSHQVRMEKQHLTRALEQTYGEKSEPILKQTFNTITLKAERLRQMLVVCPENMYVVDPKSWCVLRRVPLHKMQKVCYSNLSDGLVVVGVEGQYDLVMEVDKKQEIIKLLKETYEGHTSKTLKVENKEEFQFCPRKGITKSLKFVKNFGAKATVIEAIPEGLQVSIKPSEDIYNGEKKRRKASFTKAYHGDYIRLQHSELMKTLEKEHGDKFVSFSGVVAKYNKHYKKQERILMITERAMYNIDPNGYIVNRRIELRRIKGASVSPFTDNFFILHVPDEYDYVFESSKKTEVLKALVENYTASTRGTMKVSVKPDITYKYSKKDPNAVKVMHWEESVDYPETTLVPSKQGADIFVLPEDVMSRHMKSAVVQDIYMGQKMRRKESLYKNYLGDYLHLANHKVMAKIAKKYGENKLLYSGVVSKINNRYVVQDRKLLITEGAIYNLDKEGFGINRRIPLKSVKSIMVSTLKDGFFVLRVPDEYDYLFASPNKTEIIKTILDAQKRLVGSEGVNKPIEVIVDDTILYSPFHPSKGKGIRTIEFKSDDAVKLPTIFPTPTGVLVKVNINFDEGEIDSEINDDSKEAQAKWGLKDDGQSIYQGRKRRNKRSKSREELGDYLRLKESANLKALLKQFGDQELLFSSEVNKINKKFKSQSRVIIITEKALYNIDPENFKLKRRIPLENIDGISVSSLTDGHFVLHMPKEYDYLMESDKKTEIINVLSRAMKRGQKDLTINVADKFEFCPSGDDVCSVSFVLDENNDDSFIESTHNGLVVHVQHNEPGVILEAAYVHIKDQQKPIEIKNSQTLIKLSKKWKYKLEIRFYVSEHLQGCSFVEKIDTVTQRQEFKSQIGDLEPREERYVIMLPERQVLHSLFSKTRVKAKLIDPLGRVLLAVRFTYDVK